MKIVFVGNTAWSMYNFRLGLFLALKKKGHKVIVIAPFDEYTERLTENGIETFSIKFDNKGANPLVDLQSFIALYRLYKKVRPELIFHFTIKPNVYGTFAARLLKIPSVAITTGLGYVFLNRNFVSRMAIYLYKKSFVFPLQVWFLNADDQKTFIDRGIVKENKTFILPGEGISVENFKPIPYDVGKDKFIFLLFARLLWDKGIKEYVDAGKMIKKQNKNVELQILGFIDALNPTAIGQTQITKWHQEGAINYLGETSDVKRYIANADSIVLPSYREGIPRTLLEASAMEKPIITTNAIGCKEVIEDGVTGYMCKIKDSKDLADKMIKMMNLTEVERKKMGEAGRKKVEKEYSEKIVIGKYLKFIQEHF